MKMQYHLIAFLIGILLDLAVGDPAGFPHPVRLMGTVIGKLTKRFLGPFLKGERNPRKEKTKGKILVLLVVIGTALLTMLIIVITYRLHPLLGIAAEAVLTCYAMAAKSLYTESMRVYKALQEDGLEAARYAVSMIVGRDTECLDETGVTKAAVETVAENTSDGVIAPLLYLCLGGPILGLTYKAVNTMDSMVGYHNDAYEHFGSCAAKLDDVVNYLPARISAGLMIAAAYIGGKEYSGKDARRIFKRDRYNHKSPNSAQTESVCAGALGIRLAGDASYFGKVVEKPTIGDPGRDIESEDIKRAGRLMFLTEGLAVLLYTIMMTVFL